MFTPYDWQEGIGHRAQYIEAKLEPGAPVIGVSLNEGILFFTYRRQGRKLYEIYDRLIFGGLGQQSDVESLRLAALEFCSREGFNRSEEDVTLQRVVVGLSRPLKTAFSDFSTAPMIARILLAEIGETVGEDRYYTLDYDGDYNSSRLFGAVSGTEAIGKRIAERMAGFDAAVSAADALPLLEKIWAETFVEGDEAVDMEGLAAEALLLERSDARVNRFRLLTPEE